MTEIDELRKALRRAIDLALGHPLPHDSDLMRRRWRNAVDALRVKARPPREWEPVVAADGKIVRCEAKCPTGALWCMRPKGHTGSHSYVKLIGGKR